MVLCAGSNECEFFFCFFVQFGGSDSTLVAQIWQIFSAREPFVLSVQDF